MANAKSLASSTAAEDDAYYFDETDELPQLDDDMFGTQSYIGDEFDGDIFGTQGYVGVEFDEFDEFLEEEEKLERSEAKNRNKNK